MTRTLEAFRASGRTVRPVLAVRLVKQHVERVRNVIAAGNPRPAHGRVLLHVLVVFAQGEADGVRKTAPCLPEHGLAASDHPNVGHNRRAEDTDPARGGFDSHFRHEQHVVLGNRAVPVPRIGINVRPFGGMDATVSGRNARIAHFPPCAIRPVFLAHGGEQLGSRVQRSHADDMVRTAARRRSRIGAASRIVADQADGLRPEPQGAQRLMDMDQAARIRPLPDVGPCAVVRDRSVLIQLQIDFRAIRHF